MTENAKAQLPVHLNMHMALCRTSLQEDQGRPAEKQKIRKFELRSAGFIWP